MKDRTFPPEILRDRIAKVKTQRRRLQLTLQDLQRELRLAEAERRDREQMAMHDPDRAIRSSEKGDRR